MTDTERALTGLKNLRDAILNDYIRETDQAIGTIDDAIKLLKEQQKKTAEHNGMTETVSRTIGQNKVFQLFTDMIAWVAKRTLRGYEFEQFIQEFFKEKD